MKLKMLVSVFLAFTTSSSAFADQARLVFSDRDAMQTRVDLIQQAKKEILIEYFTIWSDDQTLGGMALLVQAAHRGVKIKIIVDALAVKVHDSSLVAFERLARNADGSNNIEMRVYNPIIVNPTKVSHRDHSKMMIVDGKVLLTGGRNIGEKYFGLSNERNFTDLDILLNGEAVREAQQNYMEVWNSDIVRNQTLASQFRRDLDPANCIYQENESGCLSQVNYLESLVKQQENKLKSLLQEIMVHEKGDLVQPDTGHDWLTGSAHLGSIQFLSHKPDEIVTAEDAYLTRDLLKVIASVQTEVSFISPYVIPTPELMKVLQDLRSRNVKVRIITNSIASTDNLLAQAGYRSRKQDLVKLGVEIYEYRGPDTLHAKAAIFDSQRILVCTCNLDPRSAAINREVGVLIRDERPKGLVQELHGIFELFRKNSYLVARDGVEYNQDKQFEGVSALKRQMLLALKVTVPMVIDHL